MTVDEHIEEASALVQDENLNRDLAQIGARVTLNALAPRQAQRVAWNYSTNRVLRNLSAVSLALQELALQSPEEIPGRTAEARFAAQAWERLAALADGTDARSALLTAAINYDLAGFQANAVCLARRAADLDREVTGDPLDLAATFIQRRYLGLLDVAKAIRREPSADELDEMTVEQMADRAALAVMADGLVEATGFFLRGSADALETAIERLRLASEAFASLGQGSVFALTRSVQRGLQVMARRSTWTLLWDAAPDNPRWTRYLRVLARGLGRDLLASHSVSELWPSQVSALERGLLSSSESFVVRMPTSAGKTRVAELAMVHTLASHPLARCVYIAPYRALASEVQSGLENLFADLGYAASTVPGTYEQDSLGQLVVSTDQLLVLTPEKLDLLLRLQPEVLAQLRLVVVDEGHVVADATRGPKFELLISRLRRLVPNARFLFMSAVVPRRTLEQLAEWLGGSPDSIAVTGWRPSIQRYAKLEWTNGRGTLRYSDQDVETGGLRFVPNLVERREFSYVHPDTGRRRQPKFPDSKGQVAAELAYVYARQGPVLIYCATTPWAQSVARELMERVRLAELTNEVVPQAFRQRASRSSAVAAEWLGGEHEVVRMLDRGIAFHHGRLPEAVRESIVHDVRNRGLDVLVATSTLAQGVNLPFRTVIIHSARRYDEERAETTRLPARDYWNIAGRAGRAGQETEGIVIHIVQGWQDEQDFQYYEGRRGRVEQLESALLRILRDLLSRRISSDEAAQKLDSDLLALLVEEDAAILDASVLESTIGSTFFAIQAVEEQLSTAPLMSVIHSTVRSIAARVRDPELRRVYASTGLSSLSCELIREHVDGNAAAVAAVLRGEERDRALMLQQLLDGTVGLREMASTAPDVGGLEAPLALWLDGVAVSEISGELGEDPADVTRFIEDMYVYRLPWGLAGYIRVAGFLLGIEDVDSFVANLPSMVKYGVPTPEAAWAMTAGVAPRRAALELATRYIGDVDEASPANFRRWLSRLDPELLDEEFGLTGAALEAAARAVFKSGTNEFLARLDQGEDLFPLEADVRPQRRAVDRGVVARLAAGDALRLSRDYDSIVNRNAVLVGRAGATVGYLPWAAAQAVAPELDAGVDLRGVVLTIEEAPTGLSVRVRVDRANE